MKTVPVYEIDGRQLYLTFVAGAKKILEKQHHLNKINVFPVNDGDTGSNMATTVRSVIDTIRPHRSFSVTADRIAEQTLINARGNSGIIFAQFLFGLSRETGGYNTLTTAQFASGVRNSVPYMYEAVANPVEGTMLTVIKDWSVFLDKHKETIPDFRQLFISSKEIIARSLQETKQKLLILAKSNVVDAGANAFVIFIEGIIEFIHSESIRKLLTSKPFSLVVPEKIEHIPQEVQFRYCTEGILQNITTDNKTLASILKQDADSVIIGGNDKIKHIHVHTNDPADLFHRLKDVSVVTNQKADDILRQSEVIYNRKFKIALVTDSTCDLPQDLIDSYQINVLPLNINFGERHYLDRVTIRPEQFYELLDELPEFPKTSQVNEKTFSSVYAQLAPYYDSIIAVHLTDKFSGTFYSSQKAAEATAKTFNKPITVLNSKSLSGSLGLVILRIARAIESGLSHNEIVSNAEQWINDTRIFVNVRTLKYMVRGGRVSYLKGFIANILNINPIVSMDENGKSYVFGKTYSQKSNMEKVMNLLYKEYSGRKIWNYIVLHAQNADGAEWYVKKMKELTGAEPVAVVNISPVIGSNAGIGAVAIALMLN